MESQDGEPRTIATITVDSLEEAAARVIEQGGSIVVEKFSMPTVGYGMYFRDPGGLIVGLHEYDREAV